MDDLLYAYRHITVHYWSTQFSWTASMIYSRWPMCSLPPPAAPFCAIALSVAVDFRLMFYCLRITVFC